jgi:hypothetical protein
MIAWPSTTSGERWIYHGSKNRSYFLKISGIELTYHPAGDVALIGSGDHGS